MKNAKLSAKIIIQNLEALTERVSRLERDLMQQKHIRYKSLTDREKVSLISRFGAVDYLRYLRTGIPPGLIPTEPIRKHIKDENVQAYINTCQKLNKSEPTLDELKNETGKSKSTWSRLLGGAAFLTNLCLEIEKRGNRSRNKTKKEFWAECIIRQMNKLEKMNLKLPNSNVEYRDEINPDGVRDYLSERYAE